MKAFGLIIILLAATVAAFGQEGSMLTGIVRDANGPVAGATVTATGPADRSKQVTKTATSQADGSYYLGFTGYGMFRISAFIETNGVRYESQIKDPWGTVYTIKVPGEGGQPYAVISLGSDKSPGGKDTAADVDNNQ